MSLALLMTFSTCDPFNKSVHIKPCVLFILTLGKSEHVKRDNTVIKTNLFTFHNLSAAKFVNT